MPKMHTKDKLAALLLEADLPDMAAKAREGYYHDFLSPLDMPASQLIEDLEAARTPAARALRDRAVQGEFDANSDEADDWADGPEGRELLGKLTGGGHG